MKLNFRCVCIFWGLMDLFYIVRFVWINVTQGRIPLVEDIINFSHISSQHGGGVYITIAFLSSLTLNVSIIFSSVLLLRCWRKSRVIVYAQIPFRIFLTVPSLSFLPWLLNRFDISGLFFLLGILIFSELLKLGTFMFANGDRHE